MSSIVEKKNYKNNKYQKTCTRFKTANLEKPIYLCNLDLKYSSKSSIRTKQNLETQKHASSNTKKKS